jgi:peptidoglycan/xylan/chitin deacetylase (PgdA/CDA1 family)
MKHGVGTRALYSDGSSLPRKLERYINMAFKIGSHSLTHPVLTRLSNVELRREVTDSKHRLEDLLGNEVSSFAYPWGEVDVRVRGAVAEAGYKFAMSTEEGANFRNDRFSLKRVNVSGQDTLFEFTLKLATGRDYRQRLLGMARGIGAPPLSGHEV